MSAEKIKKNGFCRRVLIVDDSPTNLMVISSQLENMGYAVTTAVNGNEAIEYAMSHQFDLILMDLLMPELNGTEAISYLRSQGITTPTVAITGKIDNNSKQECREYGFDGCLGKSFTAEQLNDLLASCSEITESGFDMNRKSDSQDKVIDVQSLWDNHSDEKFINEITACFLQVNAEVMAELAKAVKDGDVESVHNLSHKLKGSSLVIKANILSALADKLETVSRDGNDKILMARIMREIEKAFTALEGFLSDSNWLKNVLEPAV